jgi:ribosomal protein S18 acetylase RimI-like enzyme
MSSSVRVREATVDDRDEIRDVAEAAWYAAYGGLFDPATIASALEEYYDPKLVGTAIEHDAIAFYVAEVDGAVVGFASAEQTWADEVELHTIYVHPDRWGEGIGSALLEQIMGWAREEGVDRIACGVLAGNAVGIGFFEAVGFDRGRETEAEIAGELRPEYEFELPL